VAVADPELEVLEHAAVVVQIERVEHVRVLALRHDQQVVEELLERHLRGGERRDAMMVTVVIAIMVAVMVMVAVAVVTRE